MHCIGDDSADSIISVTLSKLADSQWRIGYSPLFAADIPRNQFIGEKPPWAAVRILNENNCTALHIYTVTVNIRSKFV